MVYYSKYTYFIKIPDTDSEYGAIMYNRLTGGSALLNDGEYEKLSKFETGKYYEDSVFGEHLSDMKKNSFVFKSDSQEKEMFGQLYEEYKVQNRKSPIQFHLVTTYGCNLACTYCFEGDVVEDKIKYMDLDTLESAKIYIKEFIKDHGISKKDVNISLFGGEPLLYAEENVELIKNICEFVRENEFTLSITTNGYHLNKFLDTFSSYKDLFNGIQITIDGLKEDHDSQRMKKDGTGSFDQISKNITEALDHGYPINLRMNLNETTVKKLPDMFKMYENLGWLDKENLFMNFGRIMEFYNIEDEEKDIAYTSRMKKLLVESFKIVKEYNSEYEKYFSFYAHGLEDFFVNGIIPYPAYRHCIGTVNVLAMDFRGNVYPCSPGIGREEWVLAKFHPQFEEGTMTIEDFRNRTIMTIDKCKECPDNVNCGGGCAILAHSKSGNYMEASCNNINENIEIGLEFFWENLKERIVENRNKRCC